MIGATVPKGTKTIPIVSFNVFTYEDKNGEERQGRSGRVFHLFHVSQLEDVNFDALKPIQEPPSGDPKVRDPAIEAFVARYLSHTGIGLTSAPSAFYTPELDRVGIPDIDLFLPGDGASAEEHYYSTLLHELIHSTGVGKRLDRECFALYQNNRVERAKEELIAEIGSVMLGRTLGLQAEPREDNAAYVASWIKLLQDRPKAIFEAASAAQAALTFMQSQAEQTAQAA